MIKLEELRVDNWIMDNFTNQYGKIIGMDTNNENININVYGCEYEVPYRQISPVQLSEEILLKSGFREACNLLEEGDKKWTCGDGNFLIRYRKGHYKLIREIHTSFPGGWADVEFGNDGCMDYLHQLQNIIMDLTGKELEVKL